MKTRLHWTRLGRLLRAATLALAFAAALPSGWAQNSCSMMGIDPCPLEDLDYMRAVYRGLAASDSEADLLEAHRQIAWYFQSEGTGWGPYEGLLLRNYTRGGSIQGRAEAARTELLEIFENPRFTAQNVNLRRGPGVRPDISAGLVQGGLDAALREHGLSTELSDSVRGQLIQSLFDETLADKEGLPPSVRAASQRGLSQSIYEFPFADQKNFVLDVLRNGASGGSLSDHPVLTHLVDDPGEHLESVSQQYFSSLLQSLGSNDAQTCDLWGIQNGYQCGDGEKTIACLCRDARESQPATSDPDPAEEPEPEDPGGDKDPEDETEPSGGASDEDWTQPQCRDNFASRYADDPHIRSQVHAEYAKCQDIPEDLSDAATQTALLNCECLDGIIRSNSGGEDEAGTTGAESCRDQLAEAFQDQTGGDHQGFGFEDLFEAALTEVGYMVGQAPDDLVETCGVVEGSLEDSMSPVAVLTQGLGEAVPFETVCACIRANLGQEVQVPEVVDEEEPDGASSEDPSPPEGDEPEEADETIPAATTADPTVRNILVQVYAAQREDDILGVQSILDASYGGATDAASIGNAVHDYLAGDPGTRMGLHVPPAKVEAAYGAGSGSFRCTNPVSVVLRDSVGGARIGASIRNGESFTVLGYEDYWVEVQTASGETGWVSGFWLHSPEADG